MGSLRKNTHEINTSLYALLFINVSSVSMSLSFEEGLYETDIENVWEIDQSRSPIRFSKVFFFKFRFKIVFWRLLLELRMFIMWLLHITNAV